MFQDEESVEADEEEEEELPQQIEKPKTSSRKPSTPKVQKAPKLAREPKPPAASERPARRGLADVRIDAKSLQKRAPVAGSTSGKVKDAASEDHDHAALAQELKVRRPPPTSSCID